MVIIGYSNHSNFWYEEGGISDEECRIIVLSCLDEVQLSFVVGSIKCLTLRIEVHIGNKIPILLPKSTLRR